MRNQGLGSWPRRRARMTPERVAVAHGPVNLTYRELHERSLRLAHTLRDWGIRRGDRVAYFGPNHPSYLETLFACGLLGAVFVPVNFRLTTDELNHVLRDSGARLLIYAPSQSRGALAVRQVPIAELLLSKETAPIDEPVELSDPCLIMYTSGSTGSPKGAVLTHGNLTWNCVNVLVESDITQDEVTLVVAPLFHAAALGMVCLPTLLKGGTVVLQEKFDPVAVLDAIEQQQITLTFGVPTMYDALAGHPRWADADLSSIRTLLCGGSPVPTETIKRYLDRGLVFVQGYGMTEAAPGVLLLDRDHVLSKSGSAGVPSFFTDVRVVRPDMSEVDPGEKGEVVVSGPNVTPGYWGADALREDWFHSGDVATVDEDGYVFVVDRMKDMIISGGENIYPAEVENVLHAHEAVEACAVIGVAHEQWGEVGKAIVVLRNGHAVAEAALLGFLREHLAAYKVPKSVLFTTALPTTGSGKVHKAKIRELFG